MPIIHFAARTAYRMRPGKPHPRRARFPSPEKSTKLIDSLEESKWDTGQSGVASRYCRTCDSNYQYDSDTQKCERCRSTKTSPFMTVIYLVLSACFFVLVYASTRLADGQSGNKTKAYKIGRLHVKLSTKWKIVFVGYCQCPG